MNGRHGLRARAPDDDEDDEEATAAVATAARSLTVDGRNEVPRSTNAYPRSAVVLFCFLDATPAPWTTPRSIFPHVSFPQWGGAGVSKKGAN